MEPMLRLATLGRFALVAGGKALPTPPTKKARALLAHLVMHRGRDVPREQIMEAFWPGFEPSRARENLNVSLSAIRRSLRSAELDPDSVIFSDRAVVRWIAPVEFDVEVLERATSDPTSVDPADVTTAYNGDFLEGDYDAWTVAQRERIAGIYERLLIRTVGETQDVAAAEKLIGRNPYDEAAYVALIESELRAGRIGAAAAVVERCREALRELDTRPSPQFEKRFGSLGGVSSARTQFRVPFTGRTDELGTMRNRLRDALSGRGSVTLVHGEPGIGKTTFLARVISLAKDLGLSTIELRGTSRDDLGTTNAALSVTFHHPSLIAVDDAHRMTERSASVLRELVLANGHRHCVVLASAPEGATLLRELLREAIVADIPLGCLSARDIESAVRQACGDDISQLARALYRRTDGQPLYAVEMLTDLVRSNTLLRGDRGWKLAGPLDENLPLPARLHARLQAHLHAGGPVPAAVAAAVAAAPQATPEEIRCALALDDTSFSEAIDDLLARGVFARAHQDGFAFAHELIADAALGSIHATRKKRLHAAFAQCIAGEHAPGTSARIARHLVAAGLPLEAAQAYLAAATESIERGTAAEALDHARAAIALIEVLDESVERDVLLGRLHRRAAVAQLMRMDSHGALDAATEAVDSLRKSDDSADLASALLTRAFAYDWLARADEQLADAREAADLAARFGNDDGTARALAEASCAHRFLCDRENALHAATRAHEIACAGHLWDAAAFAARQGILASATWWDFARAREWIAIGVADAMRAGVAASVALHAVVAGVWCLMDRFDDATRQLDEAAEQREQAAGGVRSDAYGFTISTSALFEGYVRVVVTLLRGAWSDANTRAVNLLARFPGYDSRLAAALALLRFEALFRDGVASVDELRTALAEAEHVGSRQWLASFSISYELATACTAVRERTDDASTLLRTALDVCEERARRAPLESDRAFALLADSADEGGQPAIADRARERCAFFRRMRIVAAGAEWGGAP